ncbi:MAG TPA: hypothetical protein VHC72_15150 [Bryobacteraceae bacterium]|nr:hypothetical protein [Bryobacteraceae bacterium]
MSRRYSAVLIGIFGLAALAPAQTLQRRATMVNSNEAKCTLEVVVDGAAEVEIRGDSAILRNLQGQPPQWRRFECGQVMPANPAGFRFQGIDGRGRQQLVQAPGNGRPAVIRIDDSGGGQEGYTFDIMWGVNGPGPGPISRGPYGPPPAVQGPPAGPPGRRWYTEDAVAGCQDYVRIQAARRFNAHDVQFRRTRMDDQPGRNDWVVGFFEARRPGRPPQNYRFSCSVDFNAGRVRSADVIPVQEGVSGWGDPVNGRVVQACEAAVEGRLRDQGFRAIDFGSANIDDRPGRNDWVVGTASARDRGRPVWFDFSCSVNLRNGNVRSVDLNRR